nr:MAG TPA: hypothetical protein [Caudoviricetes sp.]
MNKKNKKKGGINMALLQKKCGRHYSSLEKWRWHKCRQHQQE